MEDKYFYAYMRLNRKWEREHEARPLDEWDDEELFENVLDVITKPRKTYGSNEFKKVECYVDTVLELIHAIKSVWNNSDVKRTEILVLIEACFECMRRQLKKIEKGD